MRATGIEGDVAADGADGLARGIGRVVETVGRDGEGDSGVDHAGFDDGEALGGIDAEYAVESAKVNFLGPLEIGTAALGRFKKQGHGTLVVISSVAAERPRKDNYVYGSAKSGIDAWANGAADAIAGTAVRVLVVRPGMVRTRMSAGIPEAPLTSNPDDVAKVITRRLSRGPVTVWVPGKLRWLMFVLRHLPRPIFRKISRGGKGH